MTSSGFHPALEKRGDAIADVTRAHAGFTMNLECGNRILSGAILNSTPHEVAL